MREILFAAQQIDEICEYRYNEFLKKNDELQLHCHDYYELIFLGTNSQTHYVNGGVFKLPKHTLIFVRPDDYHDLYNENNNDSVLYHIAFTKAMAASLFEFLTPNFPSKALLEAEFSPYIIPNSLETKYIINTFNSLNTIRFDDKISKNITMRSILADIFTKFFMKTNGEPQKDVPLWLSNTCRAMEYPQNFSEGISRMTQLSKKTKEHLCRSIKKYYNFTASEFINDLRLTYIANRLITSDISIIDLCYESGFSNLGWMYTLFKKKYGISPSEFRKQNAI